MQWAAFWLHDRPAPYDNCMVTHGGRLFQEWCVDQYCKVEAQRLLWVKLNQQQLRVDLYQGVADALQQDNLADIGRMVILPSSFTGGPRHMHQLYQDAMALVRKHGKPDLFITITSNPKWPEVTAELLPGQTASDRPDIVERVFKLKLDALKQDLVQNGVFGRVVADIHAVEWQKRGLPHAHILLILAPEDKPTGPEDFDRMVCADLPDKETHPELYNIVTSCMLHGPCGAADPTCPCRTCVFACCAKPAISSRRRSWKTLLHTSSVLGMGQSRSTPQWGNLRFASRPTCVVVALKPVWVILFRKSMGACRTWSPVSVLSTS
jgi:hypothetical protein